MHRHRHSESDAVSVTRLSIRPYEDGDLGVLKEITVEAFDGIAIDQMIEGRHGLLRGEGWRARKVRHIDTDVSRETGAVFVGEIDGSVVGYVTTWTDEASGIGHIPNLAVRVAFQGRGIGRRLIDHALDGFRAAGMTHAKIETLETNAVGYGLYTSMGFEELARQVHFLKEL